MMRYVLALIVALLLPVAAHAQSLGSTPQPACPGAPLTANYLIKATGLSGCGNSGVLESAGVLSTSDALSLTGAANTTTLTESGYSLTGSSTLPLETWRGTLNTIGVVPCVLCYNFTTTAYGTNSVLWGLNGGTSGTTPYLTMLANGNVGIGTTTPNQKFDVLGYGMDVGADWAGGTARTNATTKGGYISTPHYTNAQAPVGMIMGLNSNGSNAVYIGGGTSNVNAATLIALYTGTTTTTADGTERMRIDNNGNVGIGTMTPGSPLQVNGGAAIGYSASTAAPTSGLLVNGFIESPSGSVSTGTVPSNSGSCAINVKVGGQTAGSFQANGACAGGTIILAMPIAPNGWWCSAQDMTTPADTIKQTAYSASSCTLTATMASADQATFHAVGF